MPDLATRAAYFFVATFVVGKFMPLFGMLFGAGFSLLYDKLRTRFADPRRVYRRRLVFLLIFGLLHAIAAVLRRHHAGLRGRRLRSTALMPTSDAARLARATRFWWFVAAAWLLFAIVPLSGTR